MMANIEVYECDKKRLEEKTKELKIDNDPYAVAELVTWLLDNFLIEAEQDLFDW